MGEVYRTTDTNLKRQVAIKVLPASLAGDAERLARFQREAEVLASLNHPNIAQIHGLEKVDGIVALVMELVEGPTLEEMIASSGLSALGSGKSAPFSPGQSPTPEARGLPVDEALPIAKQIADALEAAHEQGIIHRDLKPANVKVRSDGMVKVLDFGLAKAMEPAAGASPSMSMSPTLTTPAMTQAGRILGTAAYMSPGQAKGKTVDKRADIWAFGCVLFEILTGQRAFSGEDVADVLSRVLQRDSTRCLPRSLHVSPKRSACACARLEAARRRHPGRAPRTRGRVRDNNATLVVRRTVGATRTAGLDDFGRRRGSSDCRADRAHDATSSRSRAG